MFILSFAWWFEFVLVMCAQHSVKIYVLILLILKIVYLNPCELNWFSCICKIARHAQTKMLTSSKLCSSVSIENTSLEKVSSEFPD